VEVAGVTGPTIEIVGTWRLILSSDAFGQGGR